MNFASDNAYGAAPEILAAVARANTGAVASYGQDPLTAELGPKMSELFERDVAVFPVITGTAANALALSTLCPADGAIFCRNEAHIAVDENGASEFFTQGARLVLIRGEHGKLTPEAIERALREYSDPTHRPAVVSITQASELGTVYTPDEIAAIARIAHAHGLKLHADGARFANALAHLGCTPAEATWKAGIDALSFGATKNGALCAEAVVFFDPALAADFAFRRRRAGHELSKMRFISAQLHAYLEDGLWLRLAGRANALARRFAEAIVTVKGAELVHPVEANEVFVNLPDATIAKLRTSGAKFYDWKPSRDGHTLARFVLSFATPETHISHLTELARG